MNITVQQIIVNTPTWVWMLLVALFILGIKNSQERAVNLAKMFVAPLIFMIWGLWTITTSFSHIGVTLTSYVIFIVPGFLIGYILNKNFQAFYIKNSTFYKKTSYLPLVIVLLNFVVKYGLNVMLVFYHSDLFHVVYSSANGLTVGLFFGGIVYTILIKSEIKNSKVVA
ncbi:MAG: hypothetical protein JSY10_08895 [Paenibacillus sp.]|nr:hypothetical protein [Paenibacillus sp.]